MNEAQSHMSNKYFPNALAIVITWNPDIAAFKRALATYAAQCRVLIVDNGSDEAVRLALRELTSDTCMLLELETNLGIATALNRGVEFGRAYAPEYFLLLDQDSLFGELTLQALVETSIRLQADGVLTPVVGPVPIDRNASTAIGMYEGLDQLTDQTSPVAMESIYTSGMLVPYALALKAQHQDNFFIDYVDTEWCYRVSNLYGAGIYVIPKARIFHKVGETALGMSLFRKRPLLVHNPIRQYFQLRNALWMMTCPYIPMRARLKIVGRCLARVLVISLSVAPRMTRLKFIACALVDGLRGRSGKWIFLPKAFQASCPQKPSFL